jgi:hypothetical protein
MIDRGRPAPNAITGQRLGRFLIKLLADSAIRTGGRAGSTGLIAINTSFSSNLPISLRPKPNW